MPMRRIILVHYSFKMLIKPITQRTETPQETDIGKKKIKVKIKKETNFCL